MLTMARRFGEDIPRILARTGAAVQRMDPDRIGFPEITWQRFVCRRGSSAADVAIGMETNRDDRCIVAISPDLRRSLLFWRWLGDCRLVRDLAMSLVNLGAAEMEENDT